MNQVMHLQVSRSNKLKIKIKKWEELSMEWGSALTAKSLLREEQISATTVEGK